MIAAEASKVYHTAYFEADQRHEFGHVIQMYRDCVHFLSNITMERFKFNAGNQKEKEGIDPHVTELRQLSTICDFLRHYSRRVSQRQNILGITGTKLKTRLLRDANITLERHLQICGANEMSEESTKFMDGGEVNFVKAKKGSQKMKYAESKKDASQYEDRGGRCKYCDGKHPPRKCPAYGRKCAKCNFLNHFPR